MQLYELAFCLISPFGEAIYEEWLDELKSLFLRALLYTLLELFLDCIDFAASLLFVTEWFLLLYLLFILIF